MKLQSTKEIIRTFEKRSDARAVIPLLRSKYYRHKYIFTPVRIDKVTEAYPDSFGVTKVWCLIAHYRGKSPDKDTTGFCRFVNRKLNLTGPVYLELDNSM